MMRSTLRNLELLGAILTGLFGLYVPFEGHWKSLPKEYYFEDFITMLVLFVLPGLLFAFSRSFYVVRGSRIARNISLIIGAYYLFSSPFLFVAGGYGGGWRMVFIVLLPAVSVFITLGLSQVNLDEK